MKHKWSLNSRTHDRTVRICDRCGMRRISRHEMEGGRMIHWVEFYNGSERVKHHATPVCESVGVEQTSADAASLPRCQSSGDGPAAVHSDLCPLSRPSTGESSRA